MSIAEKVGQMTQITLDVILKGEVYNAILPHQIDEKALYTAIQKYNIGSLLNTPGIPLKQSEWLELIEKVQKTAQEETLHKIPILYGIDAIHGVNYTVDSTLFPQQINMAASWNTDLVEAAAAITAYEARSCGIPWNFSPCLDVGRNPLWPRLWETFGEDVFMVKKMGLAMLSGYEGKQINHPYKVAACLKHFLGYSTPINGKDRTPAWIPERQLREYILPPFAAAIAAGASSVMINSGEINGIPVHANPAILKTLLRDELGFKGLVVSDWEDIKYLHTRHRVASSHKEAVKIAILAGIDMSMVPDDFSFADHLIELVEEGSIPESRLDESVRRILKLKLNLGLFENDTISKSADYQNFASEKHVEFSKEFAKESIVLLKNEGQQLPLKKDIKLLVSGFSANAIKYLNGGWTATWQGDQSDEFITNKNTLLQALKEKIGKEQITYIEGTQYDETTNLQEAVLAAKEVDHILLCLGEKTYCEFHGNIDDLALPKAQIDLANALIKTGKPVTLILLQGRPRLITTIAEKIDGIIAAFLPGSEGGNALADILFGDYNPSGKLPITYPKFANALVTYDYKNSEINSIQGSKSCYNPLYEFGHGLSYTSFKYSDLKVNKNKISKNEELEVSVEVENVGNRTGKEVVQVYLKDEFASITPSVKRLKAFKKVELAAKEKMRLVFSLNNEDLSFVGIDNQRISESGFFEINIADLYTKFELL